MPKHEENGVPAIPEGYAGKAIAVMECPMHGAHINLDWYPSPRERWDAMVSLYAHERPLPVDQMTPDQAEQFAQDLLEAAAEARAVIAEQTARNN